MSWPRLPPRRRLLGWGALLILLLAGLPRLQRENLLGGGGELDAPRALPPLPADPGAWIGSAPLTVDDLHGRVWVLKVWTFGCINCVRSIPYANGLVERFGPDLGVLGVHSPEFDWERDRARLAEALQEHGVRFPTVVDQGLDLFLALEGEAWPAFYVLDRRGRIRGCWYGELHEGTWRAGQLERLVRQLLAE
jgi:thiol-disulfide isomerase/thioredoxin